jgi:hypothetical protein
MNRFNGSSGVGDEEKGKKQHWKISPQHRIPLKNSGLITIKFILESVGVPITIFYRRLLGRQ